MEEQLPSFNGFLRVVNKHYQIDIILPKWLKNMKFLKWNGKDIKNFLTHLSDKDNLLSLILIITIHT